MNINKESVVAFRKDFEATVKNLEKMYGVSLELGPITFNEMMFKTKLTVTKTDLVNTKTGEVKNDKEAIAWHMHASRYGFKPEDFGREFSINTRKFIITGIKPSRHKYPITGIQKGTQRQFKFTTAQVINALR